MIKLIDQLKPSKLPGDYVMIIHQRHQKILENSFGNVVYIGKLYRATREVILIDVESERNS